ncbi:hypothetical protein DNU06_13440 [Putridiphycobacter roseus]|uniref:Outer membrane protein beta-barrel domain-containing protein n=1 Tax=Putridiphycobacter roseus TaxID=2219161 RepID=A0A2W1N075_9FLAO|nr:hypothetical protein [Putridiphycobacter roseus]PZE16311.1 hypothetical protein DNU06_13440 [Putridiphycobacter roseus]
MKLYTYVLNILLSTFIISFSSNSIAQKQISIYSSISPYGLPINREKLTLTKIGTQTNKYLTSQYFSIGISDLYKKNILFSLEFTIQNTAFDVKKTNAFPEYPMNEFEWVSSTYKLNQISRRLGFRLDYILSKDQKIRPIAGWSIHLRRDFYYIEKGSTTYQNINSNQTKKNDFVAATKLQNLYVFYDIRFGALYAFNHKLSLMAALELSAGKIAKEYLSYPDQIFKFELAIPISFRYTL